MLKILALFLPVLLAACLTDDADETVPYIPAPSCDAGPVATPPPAVKWEDWGNACEGGSYGIESCRSSAGELGVCIRDTQKPLGEGLYEGACSYACLPQPPYSARCAPDAVAVDHGDGQGCRCVQRVTP